MWPFKKKQPPAIEQGPDDAFEPPEVLGLGKLAGVDQNGDDRFHLHYVDHDGEPIYEIAIEPRKVIIEEFYAGDLIKMTSDADFAQGFLKHMGLEGKATNRRHQALKHAIERQFNAHVHFGGVERVDFVTYFPAGLLFDVRVPITAENETAVVKLWSDIDTGATTVQIYELSKRRCVLLRLREAEVAAEELLILQAEVTLFDLFDLVVEFEERGLIPKAKPYRLEGLDRAFTKKHGFAIHRYQDQGQTVVFARVIGQDSPNLRAHFLTLARALGSND